ncbi:MAG TPA: DUF58 domain-containing protein [Chitinophagaceae bacterium]|nr:DUF58 domain-containing protein [Chitinophagaceae bacterium]
MKKRWEKYISNLFFSRRLYAALCVCAVLFLLRFFIAWIGVIPFAVFGALVVFFVADYLLLFFSHRGMFATRSHAERFSNGDENPVRIDVENFYGFAVQAEIIDEIPHQFQRRDILFRVAVPAKAVKIIHYQLRPVKRGSYEFGRINMYISSTVGLVKRRFRFDEPGEVPVYPSYLQMRKYQLMAIHNRLSEAGIKKMRRIGHSMEFEQIKEYVWGDDYRTVNWKATARKGQLMVNHFTDEKSQQVYCVIDKGRTMKMPFEGLSLLDYAINASLVLTNVALLKQDKAGLITFSEKLGTVLMADKKATQMQAVLEVLYNQKTRYLESDFERLYAHIRTRITQRSLLVLFTNFESMTGLQRQLPYLRKIAQNHLLLVVFFENTELRDLTGSATGNIESVYVKTIAEKFAFEKKLIVKELQKYGILSILSPPQNVTINTLNKYLELKARQAI